MEQPKEKTKCEGNCIKTHGTHHVEVFSVKVSGNGCQQMPFNYCKNAIREDVRRGFLVEILEKIE